MPRPPLTPGRHGDRAPDLAARRELVTGRLGAACAPVRVTVIAKPPVAPSGKPDQRLLGWGPCETGRGMAALT
ncbi:hypothetical protein, partial [Saccharothrix longispora]|uniref:hypothetical protein n=1 Tax=Saccharothrix longispora TaxID=33920 RepID=UPI0028FD4E1B